MSSAPDGVADLAEVMARLRRECAWTAAQTHESLTRYLLEEAHEVLAALDSGDLAHFQDELGDLLFQVVFHARIAEEGSEGAFDLGDVAQGIADKLRRRNPHVFGDGKARTSEEIDAAWQAVKAQEATRASVHDGIPPTLPALMYADKVLKRLGDPEVTGDDLGSRLLALVAEARAAGLDPETELRRTVRALPEG
ncbi:MAG: MazG family protein [Aeromicrobium sp.]|uniref:MazG nucleotide pyrophosphohydrolase domain-containing protein n=1 Tax=Aeromicrobium sp. TaxID=1871063 RepID=UPI0039E56685